MMRLLTLLARFESRLPQTSHQSPKQIPRLLVLSDDARGFTLANQMAAWPRGAAFIERTFGGPVTLRGKAPSDALRLATCAPSAARRTKLDGVHWPQGRLKHRLACKTKGLIETTSVHSGLALAKATKLGMDAVLVSTAFKSSSPSATRPLGAIRLAQLQRAFPRARIYALGGIGLKTTRSLARTGICGVALVSYQRGYTKS